MTTNPSEQQTPADGIWTGYIKIPCVRKTAVGTACLKIVCVSTLGFDSSRAFRVLHLNIAVFINLLVKR